MFNENKCAGTAQAFSAGYACTRAGSAGAGMQALAGVSIRNPACLRSACGPKYTKNQVTEGVRSEALLRRQVFSQNQKGQTRRVNCLNACQRDPHA
jgi:hypothetical protein